MTAAPDGFAGRLGPGEHPAVLVVDPVMAYLDPSSPLYAGVEEAVAAAAELVRAGRAAGAPVLFTTVRYTPGGADGGLWWRKIPALRVLAEGSPLGDFPAALQPAPGETVVVKQYASGFFGTSLAATLRVLGVDTLVMGGLTTSGCVRATAVDAISSGLRPLVVRDACGDRDPGPHAAALYDIDTKYGDVIGLDEARDVLRAPGSPASRSMEHAGRPVPPTRGETP